MTPNDVKILASFEAAALARGGLRTDDVLFFKRLLDEAHEALRWYADENRYDYDNDCCPEKNNPAHKTAEAGILDDRGDRARRILNI